MNSEISTLALYIIIFLISITLVKYSNKINNKKEKNFLLILSMIPLWFLNVFRASSVGTDYIQVGKQFTYINNSTSIFYTQGYNWFWLPLKIFCKIVGFCFGSEPFWFYLICGTLTIYFLYKNIRENSDYSKMFLILFIAFGLYLQSFNQTRQILAMIIILYAIKYIKEQKFFKYTILILFASIFHETALIFIPLYFLAKIKLDKKTIVLYFTVTIILFLGEKLLYNIIYMTKYSIYFTTIYNVSKTSSLFNTIVRVTLLIFCYIFKKDLIEDKKYNFCYHMISICAILQILTMKYYFLGRLTTYFFAFYIVLLPRCLDKFLEKISFKYRNILKILIYVLIILYFMIYYFSPSGSINSGYNMYNFIFEEWSR